MLYIFNNALRNVCILVGILCIGSCGGLISGFIILSFGFYIGKAGSTGIDYVGFWDPEYALWLASWTGAPLGGVSFMVAYYTMLKRNKLEKGTGRYTNRNNRRWRIGAFSNLWVAVALGVAGFWTACLMIFDLDTKQNTSSY